MDRSGATNQQFSLTKNSKQKQFLKKYLKKTEQNSEYFQK
jgi:hypothetical protein